MSLQANAKTFPAAWRLTRPGGLWDSSGPSGPALRLPFYQMTSGADLAAKGVTYTSSGLATQYDSTGKLTWKPNNLLTYSSTFANAAWTKQSNVTVTDGTVAAPDGSMTGATVEWGGASNNTGLFNVGGGNLPVGANAIGSLYVRADVAGGTVALVEPTGNGGSATITLTTSWQRISFPSVGATGLMGVWLRKQSDSPSTVYVAAAQAEAVTWQAEPRAYVATAAAAYYGPRFDFDPATLLALGLLLEGSRTNECLYSSDFSNAAWLKLNAGTGVAPVVTANYAVSPDGTSNASRIQLDLGATPGTAQSRIFQGSLDALTVARAKSIWFKTADGSTKTVYIQGPNANNTLVTVNGTWTRFKIEDNQINSGSYAQMQFGLDGALATSNTVDLLVFGADVEQGSSVTSYIPTTSAAVTRASETASMTGTDFSRWYNPSKGTFVAEAQTTAPFNDAPRVIGFNGGATPLYVDAGPKVASYSSGGGVSSNSFGGGKTWAGGVKVAAAYDAAGQALVGGGGTVKTDAALFTPTAPTTLYIGSNGGVESWLSGHIMSLEYYNTRLPDPDLQLKTAA